MMKVFLSWSGDLSQSVAGILRDWLPSVIQIIEPYVSSEDIDKGARWSTDIAQELDQSSYGILCVTPENLNAPWLNFEAGALSKTIDKSFVSPFLFGVKRSEVQGPILQFQSTIYEEEDIRKLLGSLNNACAAEAIVDSRLDKAFDVWWPTLQQQLEPLLLQSRRQNPPPGPSRGGRAEIAGDILEEILELVRAQQRLFSNPEAFLPRDYLASALSQRPPLSSVPIGAWSELADIVEVVGESLTAPGGEGEMAERMRPIARRLDKLLDFFLRRLSPDQRETILEHRRDLSTRQTSVERLRE